MFICTPLHFEFKSKEVDYLRQLVSYLDPDESHSMRECFKSFKVLSIWPDFIFQ